MLFRHYFHHCIAIAFQRQRQQAGGVKIGNATISLVQPSVPVHTCLCVIVCFDYIVKL